MLRAEMNHRCPKRRSSIVQNFVYPLSALILRLQIISIEHAGTAHPCAWHAGEWRFQGQSFDDEPRRDATDVRQIWFRPTEF
jgi:hypothetical protein